MPLLIDIEAIKLYFKQLQGVVSQEEFFEALSTMTEMIELQSENCEQGDQELV